jgi:FkbM family methyltransferase
VASSPYIKTMTIIKFDNPNSETRPLSADSILGKVIRAPLRLIPPEMTLPILQGPGHGMRWIVGSYNHSCWLGFYEYEKQAVLKNNVAPGDCVYDLGAHVGYFSIIFARLVQSSGIVYAFEPLQQNFSYLLRHLAINRLTNVVPIQAGVCASSGQVRFDTSTHSAKGRCSMTGALTCSVYNLVEYISTHALRTPTLIKMDIEGEEASVVPSIVDYTLANNTKLLISTHSDSITAGLVDVLERKGYSVIPLQWVRLPARRLTVNASLLLATL